jgi:glycosyltransferase involved in cell wall biosynthesis
VEPPHVAAWAARLERLLAQRDQLAALAEPARAWVRQRYSWTRIVEELQQRYEWVLQGCPAAAFAGVTCTTVLEAVRR